LWVALGFVVLALWLVLALLLWLALRKPWLDR
jgi:hypothetical protein